MGCCGGNRATDLIEDPNNENENEGLISGDLNDELNQNGYYKYKKFDQIEIKIEDQQNKEKEVNIHI